MIRGKREELKEVIVDVESTVQDVPSERSGYGAGENH